ncbi:MAG: glycerate kinase [Bacillus subtilis]|nr:glycerate kinase [Bacillus subtilis]
MERGAYDKSMPLHKSPESRSPTAATARLNAFMKPSAAPMFGSMRSMPGADRSKAVIFGSTKHRALIELAATAGLTIAGNKLNPRQTTTAGVGMQIAAAIADGAKEILLAIGGSATNDMGVGMLESLGVVFRDANGGVFHPVGESLSRIRRHRYHRVGSNDP